LKFTTNPGTYFWSNGSAWGKCLIEQKNGSYQIILSVLHGSLKLNSFRLENRFLKKFEKEAVIEENNDVEFILN